MTCIKVAIAFILAMVHGDARPVDSFPHHTSRVGCAHGLCMRIVGTHDYVDQKTGMIVHDDTFDGEPPRDAVPHP